MWCELNYPSFISAPSQPGQGPVVNQNDRRATVIALGEKRDRELLELRKLAKAPDGKLNGIVKSRVKATKKEAHLDLISSVVLSMSAVMGLGLGISWFVLNKLSPDS